MKASTHDDRPWIPPDLADGEGLVGVGGDLTPSTLLKAYTDGVFPWFNDDDPILWWSPDPRAVIEFANLHVSRSLARTMRSGKFHVTIDQCFEMVMRECGERRPEGTWVTDGMVKAYSQLHRLGHAHSLEVWVGDDLAGGIYGVGVGTFFAGESMFHRVTDGSKVALVSLLQHLRERGYELFDVQMTTDHTERMGATEISRTEYLHRLRKAVNKSHVRFV
ncbi:leucyl/phenylalanyl-tRNA--protein transferase [Limnoglobus roseus]|uniref:Leucyl/phenylalanyl-tRNA--protein transferase n=1 Tax=Limnoglobus roseus TaxID=2598579 RepID=A0A5C1AMB2_9BACT|nr:leucyl/phenylalanyl-tRNA--protein transferase [Limnoglobus roseus]QEL20100.1 leucyl/phenylalanyl-tRNA--protein transferase [Limnoglobus roseus]